MVGSNEPIRIDYDLIERRFQYPKVIEDLKNIAMTEPYMFTAQFSMDRSELIEYCKDAPANTDDFPVVEFSTVVNIAPDTSALKFIADHVVDYGAISFEDTLNSETRDDLILKMQHISKARVYNILDIIADVGRQTRAFLSGKK
jgi:hypothetical protein